MSHNKQHVFVYCADNQEVATQLAGELARAGFHLQNKELSETTATPMLQSVAKPDGLILMLITDNFLKSKGCMNGALDAMKAWSVSGQVVPIVADGYQTNPDGSREDVPTSFDRVSNIIQYMNFWQDRYLSLRKELRHNEEDQNLEKELETVKTISSETGEFLRFLRTLNVSPIHQFKADQFKVFRQMNGETVLEEDAASQTSEAPGPIEKPVQKSLAEIIQDSSEELIAENVELTSTQVSTEEEQSPPVDISEIPGMDMLSGTGLQPISTATQPDGEEMEDVMEDVLEDVQEVAEDDDDDDEVYSILKEALVEDEEEESGQEDKAYRFLGDDPDNPEDFDLDSLFEDETEKYQEDEEEEQEEHVVMLDLISDDEEGLVLKADGKGHATPEEVLEHAVYLFDDGQLDKGLDYLKKTVKLNPDDNTLRYYYAYALARYGDHWKGARKQLILILENDNEHPDAWFLLGEVAEHQGKFTEAKEYFEKAASLQPDYPEVFYRLGLLTVQYFEEEDAKAAGYFKKAISHNHNNADAHYLLATLLNERLGDPVSAMDYFQTTLEIDSSHPFANYDLALLYHQLGERGQAKAYYDRAAALNPELKTPQNDEAFFVEKTQPAVETEELDAGEVEASAPAITPDEPAGTPTSKNGQAPSSEPLPEARPLGMGEIIETVEDVAAAVFISGELDLLETPAPITEKAAPQPEKTAWEIAAPQSVPTDDKPVVLITGATAGIGRATAEVFAANGYRVIATGRRQDRLDGMKNDFKEKYQNDIQVLPFDVRDNEALQAALETLPGAWQNIDILINNAGLSRGLAPIHEGDPEHWDAMIDTNIKGLLYMTRAVAPQMVERRCGHIINVASGAGKEVYPNGNVYCATKFAVDALTKSMRLDLFKHNVRVSQVAPGHVEETEFASVRFDGNAEQAAQVYEGFQPLKSSDVAEAIFFIATRPLHVNIQDVLMFGTQQAGSNFIDRSGRE